MSENTEPDIKAYEEALESVAKDAVAANYDKYVALEVEQITNEMNQELDSVRQQLR